MTMLYTVYDRYGACRGRYHDHVFALLIADQIPDATVWLESL